MPPVTIRVSTTAARVLARPARTVTITPSDGARVLVAPSPGLRGPEGPAGAPADGVPVFGEIPDGVKNGANLTFTLANTPRAGSVAVYRNGLREFLGVGYTQTGADITFTTAPLSTDDIHADYLMDG